MISFTCSRRTVKQHALWNLAAKVGELARVLQELDDLLELQLGFLDAGDVVEVLELPW